MENIDLIVTWGRNCDFPLWRSLMRIYRVQFRKVIVVFMETNAGNDYRDFVRENMAGFYIDFIESPEVLPGQDWRNVSVNAGLAISDAPWILFTEQDYFIINHDKFWPKVNEARKTNKVIGYVEKASGRLHPCFLLVKRGMLDRTSKNFGVTTDGDHFARFAKELQVNQKAMSLESLGLHQRSSELDPGAGDFVHMNGLSHNHSLIHDGNYAGVYQPVEFKKYLRQCLALADLGAELSPIWKREVFEYLNSTESRIIS